jgi:hypothetical protein
MLSLRSMSIIGTFTLELVYPRMLVFVCYSVDEAVDYIACALGALVSPFKLMRI